MQASTFLARLIGPLLLAIGAGMLLNGTAFRTMAGQLLYAHALIYLSGVLTMLAGLAIINVHNLWTPDWRVVITVLGWFMVLGGVVRIVLPQEAGAVGLTLLTTSGVVPAFAIVVLLLGGWLSFMGYLRSRPLHGS